MIGARRSCFSVSFSFHYRKNLKSEGESVEDQSGSKRRKPPRPPRGKGNLRWIVQLTTPVDKPVYNVRMLVQRWGYYFEVPINYPNVHNCGFEELFEAQYRTKLFRESTDLNKKSLDSKENIQ